MLLRTGIQMSKVSKRMLAMMNWTTHPLPQCETPLTSVGMLYANMRLSDCATCIQIKAQEGCRGLLYECASMASNIDDTVFAVGWICMHCSTIHTKLQAG